MKGGEIMKAYFITAFGVIGAIFTSLFGEWNEALTTLCVFMLADYILGVTLSFVFKKSPKTKSGGLNSTVGFKGIIKKITMLLIVLIGSRADILLNVNFIQQGIVYTFIANELISIVENIGLMGIPLPNVVTKAIDLLTEHSKGGE